MNACRLSLKVPIRICITSSAKIRSRSARVAWTSPCGSRARIPKWIARRGIPDQTSVESSAGTPSIGWKWEKPVSTAASCQTASSSTPSTTTVVSRRGSVTASWPERPSYVGRSTTVGTESGGSGAGAAAPCRAAASASSITSGTWFEGAASGRPVRGEGFRPPGVGRRVACPPRAPRYSLTAKPDSPVAGRNMNSRALFVTVLAVSALSTGLSAQGPRPKEPTFQDRPLSAWIADLKGMAPYTRNQAAYAIGSMGPAAKAAVPALIEALSDPEPTVRFPACIALKEIGPMPPRRCRRCARRWKTATMTWRRWRARRCSGSPAKTRRRRATAIEARRLGRPRGPRPGGLDRPRGPDP